MGSIFKPIGKIVKSIDPMSRFGGEIGETIADPMDLFGWRSGRALSEIEKIQMESSKRGVQAQRDMLAQMDKLVDPYRKQALESLGDYTAATTGGMADFAPSETYQRNISQGTSDINRRLAAMGLFGSTARGGALSDLYLEEGQNEAARRYADMLNMQRLGTGAIAQLGQAGQTAGQNVGGIYSNMGQGLAQNLMNYGQSRMNSMNQFGQAMGGLSSFMGQQ